MRKFVIARIHYTGIFEPINWPGSVLTDLDALTRLEGFIKCNGYNWTFNDAKQDEIQNRNIVSIKLTKIKPIKELEIVDEHTKAESLTEIPDVKEREGMIYIDTNSHLAAIETHGHFTNNQIQDVLVEGYKNIGLLYEPTFDFTYDDDQILEQLNKFDVADFAEFSLTTTNPHANEEFKPLDDRLRKSGVQRASVKFQSQDTKRLDITSPESIVRQSLMMAAAGYGKGKIRGYDNLRNRIHLDLGDNLIDKIEMSDLATEDEVLQFIISKFNHKDKA